MTALYRRSIQLLRDLNLFESTSPTTDQNKIKTQILSTRLYLILLAISFTILAIYTSAITVNRTITVPSPTLQRYAQLYTDYPQTLTCSCTKISQSYENFIDLIFTLHQVCSSSFVTDTWTQIIIKSLRNAIVSPYDFRVAALFQFQAIQSLCQLMNATISASRSRFYSTEYVTLTVIPASLFYSQANASIDQFIVTTIKEFALSFRLVRNIIQANGLVAASQTNAQFQVSQLDSRLRVYSVVYDNCTCAHSSQCHQQSAVNNRTSLEILFLVPGSQRGCYTVESLLQSSLECFYNETCFDKLTYYGGLNRSSDIVVMNRAVMSRFSETGLVGELLDEMMVERWDRSVMYEKYYAGCRPKECIYTMQSRNDVVYIATTVFGLIGGLSTVLQILVPSMVRSAHWLFQTKRRIHPDTVTVPTRVTKHHEDIQVDTL